MTDYCSNSIDEESEENALLKDQSKDYGTSERKQEPPSKIHKKYIPIEVVTFLSFTQIQMMLSHVQFFLHAKATANYDNIHSFNGTLSNDTDRESSIQREATWRLLLIVEITLFCSLIPTLIIGTWPDWCGRRMPMILSNVGATVYCLNVLLVVVFDINVFYICFGAIVNGIGGYFGALNASIYSMVADVTSPGTQRAWRILLVNVACYLGTLVGMVVTGVWVEVSGYLDVLYLSMALTLTSLFVIVTFVPETKPGMSGKSPRFKETLTEFKERFSFLARNENNSKLIIRLSYIAVLLTLSVDTTKMSLLPMYLQGPPLLWKSGRISLFMTIRSAGSVLVIVSTFRCLQRCLTEQYITVIGAISNIAMYCLIAFAKDEILVYSAGGCSVYVELLLPMMRSHMSHIVQTHDQGSMQSLVSLCEICACGLFIIVAGIIYNSTLSIFPGLVLILMASIMVGIIGLLLYISKLMRTKNIPEKDSTIENPSM